MSATPIDCDTTPVLNSSSAYKIPAFNNNIRVSFLLDTGAAVSLIRKDVWEQVNTKKKRQQLSPTGHCLVGVDGTLYKKRWHTSIKRWTPCWVSVVRHIGSGMQWSQCLVYLDDIIIPGRSVEVHLRNVASVLQWLRAAGLKLQPAKRSFFQKQVKYLGHVISEGVATDPTKTEKVKQWPTPSTAEEVQQFLGLANFSQKFVLDTDASNCALGAVLSQVQEDGSEKVIAYGSRLMTKTERRYCATRRELLSVVTFVKQFHPYPLGRHFKLRTDHGSLVWLKNFKEPERQSEPHLNEEELSHISMVVEARVKPELRTVQSYTIGGSRLFQLWDQLYVHKDILWIRLVYPLQIVVTDILGSLPKSKNGNMYMLVASDYFTHWAEAYAIPNQEAETVAKKLTNEMFCDGLVERFNRTLISMLATATADHSLDWEECLPKATMGRRRRLVVNFNRLKKCSSDVEAHDIRTGSKAGLTDKRLQEAAKLPLPPGNALELVDDDGNEMVVPQEIKEEEHPDAQPPRQEAADPSTQAGADNVQRYPLRDRCPPDYF
eukprot:Em0002g981a